MSADASQQCVSCREEKPLSSFDRSGKNTIRKKCRRCRYLEARSDPLRVDKHRKNAARYARSRKKDKRAYDQRRLLLIKGDSDMLARRRGQCRSAAVAYYWRNPELLRERSKQWSIDNPEKRKAQKRRYRIKHRTELARVSRRLYWQSRNARREAARDWYSANRWKASRSQREWQQRNLDRLTQYANRRRARKISNGGTHTLEEWRDLLRRHNRRCAYCGAEGRPLTRDHIMPLVLGGSDSIENIAPACRPCNSEKARMTLAEFMARRALLRRRMHDMTKAPIRPAPRRQENVAEPALPLPSPQIVARPKAWRAQ